MLYSLLDSQSQVLWAISYRLKYSDHPITLFTKCGHKNESASCILPVLPAAISDSTERYRAGCCLSHLWRACFGSASG